jgi:hypothetical protein
MIGLSTRPGQLAGNHAAMPNPDDLDIRTLLGDPAVQKHLDFSQGIVNRLAQNSVACKNWCITLVAGILVISFSKDSSDHAKRVVPFVACLPIAIFWLLDAYYHALEHCFRRQANALVRSVQDGSFSARSLLIIETRHTRAEVFNATMWVAFTSAAAGGFYLSLVVAALVVSLLAR